MNEYHFDVDITPTGRRVTFAPEDADRKVWNSAAAILGERTYRIPAGAVRVRMHWPPYSEQPSLRTTLQVLDDEQILHPRDAASFVEYYVYEAFLLLNLAVPGSFGGVIAPSGQFPVDEIALDARVFEYAHGTERLGEAGIRILPLSDVVAWYDALDLGTRQLATYGIAKVLFHLLHLSRGSEENAQQALLALTQCLELLGVTRSVSPHVFRLRDSLVHGLAPILHPLHDQILEPGVETTLIEWVDAADQAASAVIQELQARIQRL